MGRTLLSFKLYLEEPDSGCHAAALLSCVALLSLEAQLDYPESHFLVTSAYLTSHGHPAASKRQQEAEEKV